MRSASYPVGLVTNIEPFNQHYTIHELIAHNDFMNQYFCRTVEDNKLRQVKIVPKGHLKKMSAKNSFEGDLLAFKKVTGT